MNLPGHGSGISSDRKSVGEILLETGLVTREDLGEARELAQKTQQDLGELLIQKGFIKREQLGKALAILYSVRYQAISLSSLDESLVEILPEDFIFDKKVIPVANEGGRLVVAMVDPSDRPSIDEITFLTGMRPHAVVTTLQEFEDAYQKLFDASSADATSDLLDEITTAQSGQDASQDQILQHQRESELLDASNPLAKLVKSIIEDGISKNASDIHIEPRQNKYQVRFRIDGILRHALDIPKNMESSLVTRVKVISRMDISDTRRPQDGRITVNFRNTDYNLRVNTLPVGYNREKVVIRILRPSKNITDFEVLGFLPDETAQVETMYKAPYGIFLVCGPTGSGKTTTLYTILNKINEESRNISTVEDPVELTIDGLNQSQVNVKADYTFASSMRALLRQDPDVIMVGEIRDLDTLEAAIHAALTGHLVFSTIHSNTTAATITRLLEMGASPSLIASALNGVIAQRLLRTICKECKYEYEASYEEKAVCYPNHPEKQLKPMTLAAGRGCSACENTGYSGRTGIYEILVVNREIRHLINTNRSDIEIEDSAVACGMTTLGIGALYKLLTKQTTFEELIRVLGTNFMGG